MIDEYLRLIAAGVAGEQAPPDYTVLTTVIITTGSILVALITARGVGKRIESRKVRILGGNDPGANEDETIYRVTDDPKSILDQALAVAAVITAARADERELVESIMDAKVEAAVAVVRREMQIQIDDLERKLGLADEKANAAEKRAEDVAAEEGKFRDAIARYLRLIFGAWPTGSHPPLPDVADRPILDHVVPRN